MKKMSREHKLGFILAFMALIVVVPQTYATYINSSVETSQYLHVLDSTLCLNSATVAILGYSQATKILQNLTNDILLSEYLNPEHNRTESYNEIYLPMLREAQEFIERADTEIEYHNEQATYWGESYSKNVKSIYNASYVSYGAWVVSVFGVFFGLLYADYLYLFSKDDPKKKTKRKSKKK